MYRLLLDDARRAVKSGELGEAIRVVESLFTETPDWQLSEQLLAIKDSYQRLLDFMMQGGVDLERETLYFKFLRKVSEIIDVLQRKDLLAEGETHYAKTARTLQAMSIPEEIEDCLQRSPSPRMLFEKVYTSSPLSATQEETLAEYLTQQTDSTVTALLLSALLLGGMTVFDARKVRLLLRYAQHHDELLRMRAMVGALFLQVKYYDRLRLYPELEAQWEALFEKEETRAELRTIQLQLFVTLDTQAVQKRMREEILPTFVETSKELRRQTNMNKDNWMDELSKLSANPEWEKKGLLSKMSNSMRQMQELHQKGADVYLGSFTAMKNNFPFFSVATNWFYPFTTHHPDLQKEAKENSFLQLLEKNTSFCHSDRYSFFFLFRSLPEAQRRLMEQQLAMALSETHQMKREGENFGVQLRMYLQDLYRFFKLFPMIETSKVNPFAYNLLLTDYSLFAPVFHQKDILLELADLLFQQKNFQLACLLFEQAAQFEQSEAAVAAEMFQKWGFACQSLNDYQGAIRTYEKAILFAPNEDWTLRQLAASHHANGNNKEALNVTQQLLKKNADDQRALFFLSHLYMQQTKYAEARPHLLKLVYLEDNPNESVRALAWCELWLQHGEEALKQYQKLLSQDKADDFLNAGHAAWICGNVLLAVEYYRHYLSLKALPALRAETFEEDTPLLELNGIHKIDVALLIDVVNQS